MFTNHTRRKTCLESFAYVSDCIPTPVATIDPKPDVHDSRVTAERMLYYYIGCFRYTFGCVSGILLFVCFVKVIKRINDIQINYKIIFTCMYMMHRYTSRLIYFPYYDASFTDRYRQLHKIKMYPICIWACCENIHPVEL